MAEAHEGRRSGLNELSANVGSDGARSDVIAQYYDQWAAEYNDNLEDWNYQAPKVGADLLHQGVPVGAKVLDAGCGTGLSGLALRDLGYQHITGVDISQVSLDLAKRTNAYEELAQVDMQSLLLPYESNEFAGLQCVGVLTYIPDTDGISREFCRVVQPEPVSRELEDQTTRRASWAAVTRTRWSRAEPVVRWTEFDRGRPDHCANRPSR